MIAYDQSFGHYQETNQEKLWQEERQIGPFRHHLPSGVHSNLVGCGSIVQY